MSLRAFANLFRADFPGGDFKRLTYLGGSCFRLDGFQQNVNSIPTDVVYNFSTHRFEETSQ